MYIYITELSCSGRCFGKGNVQVTRNMIYGYGILHILLTGACIYKPYARWRTHCIAGVGALFKSGAVTTPSVCTEHLGILALLLEGRQRDVPWWTFPFT